METRRGPSRWALTKPYTISVAVHVGVVAGLVALAPLHEVVMPRTVEVDLVDLEPVQPPLSVQEPASIEPRSEVRPQSHKPLARPSVVPRSAVVRVVHDPKPFHANAEALNELPREPPPSNAVVSYDLSMEATVGGGDGFDVVSVGDGAGSWSGPRGGAVGPPPTRPPR